MEVSPWITFVAVALALHPRTACIQITSLEVPAEVVNASHPTVLDCVYTLRYYELLPEAGLVVKWYLNNSPAPVYQWIPGQRPQDLGVLKGRLDLRYKASEDPAMMYRALYITNPTSRLSGEYRCAVSTFLDEDFMVKKMVVYAPERYMIIKLNKVYDMLNVTCTVTGVYPEPKIFLNILSGNKTKVAVSGVQVVTSARSGEYDVEAQVVMADAGLETPTEFICELTIPETTYTTTRSINYYPGITDRVSSAMADNSSSLRPPTLIVVLVGIFMFSLLTRRKA